MVYHAWREGLGCTPEVAKMLARLTTYKGHLPQGSPTSMALANLVMAPADLTISVALLHVGNDHRYTRWVDDLIISGSIRDPQAIVDLVSRAVAPLGLKLHTKRAKRRVMYRHEQQSALGLVLNQRLTIRRSKRNNLRAAVHAVRKDGRTTHASLMGRLEFLKRCHPKLAMRMLETIKLTANADVIA